MGRPEEKESSAKSYKITQKLNQSQRKMSNQAHFLNLPSHLINDILSRLPTKTIIQCKSVCKSWLSLLSESEFTKLHLQRSPPCLIINKFGCHPSELTCFGLVEFEDEPDHHGFRYVAGTTIKPPEGCIENGLSVTMVGSINGLICLTESYHKHDAVNLWNPIMRESIALPVPEWGRSYTSTVSYGFGLSSESRKYKVVRIFVELEKNTRHILKSNCYVYTLGEETELWRRIEQAPFLYNYGTYGVFLNGNLHWLTDDQDSSELISCFNLETELFSPFPAPPELRKNFNLASLGVSGGCLRLYDNNSDDEIVIWVMKEYGIKKLWTKEFVIQKEPVHLIDPSYELVRVLKVFKDGDILLLWRDEFFLSYDCWRQILHQSGVDNDKLIKKADDQMNEDGYAEKSYPCIDVMDYVPSFLSLKNFGIQMVESTN
ncbi:unnamed protein product [Coffea canephora]|uniref:F-box domain-containing protein n=1 Tax=Coffea canephora TaxID=49390 RepID=A0A068V5S1_COFCA|nr:unnamed protein product [Coffea canephora]